MGLHSEGWDEDWIRAAGTGAALAPPSILQGSLVSQCTETDINQGQQRMSMKKRPGSRGAAAINQQLIQSCEMTRLINLCQHFQCCQAASLEPPARLILHLLWHREGPLPTTTEGRRKRSTSVDSRRMGTTTGTAFSPTQGEKRGQAFTGIPGSRNNRLLVPGSTIPFTSQ